MKKAICTQCSAVNEVPTHYIGKTVTCPHCRAEYSAIENNTDALAQLKELYRMSGGKVVKPASESSGMSDTMVGAIVLLIGILGISTLLIGGCKYLVHRSEIAKEEKELRRERIRAEIEAKYPSRDSASSGSSRSGGSYSSSGSDDVHGAWAYMQIAVQQRLKNPKRADFPFGGYRHVKPLGGGRYSVSSYVDATNSFGAEIRTSFTGVIKKVSGGWQVESLSL